MRTLQTFVPTGIGVASLALLLAFLLAPPAPAAAQATGTIEGEIVDQASGRTLAGAQVAIPGTRLSVASGNNGRFQLTGVPAGEVTVRVQLIGFQTEEQTITLAQGATATLNFQLSTRALAMDELVVTGVGQATERRQLTASVSVLSEQMIAEAPVQSLEQLLQGRVAGATVSMVSAQPGTGALINFRGVSSVIGSQTPVIYVDGVRVDNSQSTSGGTGGEQSSALSELMTSDIERIEITRGGAASTLYGSDAATGVIQIFTKRGRPGPPQITFRVEQGVDTPELRYILDARHVYPSRVESGEVPGNFIAREFFQSGWNQDYQLGITGGTSQFTYSVSGRILDTEGVQPQNEGTLYSMRGGIQANLSEQSRLTFSGSYTRHNYDRLFNGTAIADPITALEVGDVMFFTGADNLRDALDIFLMPEIPESVNRFNFSAGYQYDHSERLSFRATVGADHRNSEQTQFQPIGFIAGQAEGQLFRRQRNFTSATVDAAGTLRWPISPDYRNSVSVGVQGFRDDTYVLFGQGRGFALPGSKNFGDAGDITSGESRSQVFTGGVFIDDNLAMFDRYFLNLGVRIDAGTSFGDDVDWAAFPKVGAAYQISREPALERFFEGPVVTDLRLRAAYGETGKFPPPFLRDRTFDATSFRGESAPRFDNPGNVELEPEVTQTLEVGFEAAFWNDRIGVDFTWFDATTMDALFFVPEPPVTGLGTQIRNVGELSNKGVELDMSVSLVNRPGLFWNVGATVQTVTNRVVSMGDASPFGGQQRVQEGQPVGVWYLTTPIDTSGDGLMNGFESQLMGCPDPGDDPQRPLCTGKTPFPTRSGSFSTQVGFLDGLTLSALVDWAAGHYVFDWGSVWATFNGIYRKELAEGRSGDRDDPDFQFPLRYTAGGDLIGPYTQGTARSAFLEKGDWWKLREISARYILPQSLVQGLGVDRATVFASGRNLFISSTSSTVDPELAGLVGGGLQLGGEQSITISPPRTFRFGFEFVF
jgi:TonB-dependent starch-binding outer membrane protein SusC